MSLGGSAALDSARDAERQGRLAEAEALCRAILQEKPRQIDTIVLLGEIGLRTGRPAMAQQLFENALKFDPSRYGALIGLARVSRTVQGPERGVDWCRRAIAVEPQSAEAHLVLGTCLLDMWRMGEAIAALGDAVALDPTSAAAWGRLGYALLLDGRKVESRNAIAKAIALDPTAPTNHVNLGHLLGKGGDAAGGREANRIAFKVASADPQQLVRLGRTHLGIGNVEQADEAFRAAIELDPNAETPRQMLGQVLQEVGRFEEARSVLDDALAIHPDSPRLLYDYVYGAKLTAESSYVLASLLRAAKKRGLRPDQDLLLQYALGKAFDDLGEYRKAIGHFDKANRLALKLRPSTFDGKTHKEAVDRIIATFSADCLDRCRGLGSDSEQPVFVLGMPRSGTTLTEHILSCHPSVGAAGELTYIASRGPAAVPPNSMPRQEVLLDLAGGYLRRLDAMTDGEPRVTDKNPYNFLYAGLIHLIFPRARIIHCRRHPLDTCLSLYVTPIEAEFGHSLTSIACFYREYQRLMDHWRVVLPSESFCELDYEDLVRNPEPAERRLTRFLGLPWDDAVTHHELNPRPINTPSRWQARQPLHPNAIGRWQHYEPWISKLRDEFPELTANRAYLR